MSQGTILPHRDFKSVLKKTKSKSMLKRIKRAQRKRPKVSTISAMIT
jgi:hypothetical protein